MKKKIIMDRICKAEHLCIFIHITSTIKSHKRNYCMGGEQAYIVVPREKPQFNNRKDNKIPDSIESFNISGRKRL